MRWPLKTPRLPRLRAYWRSDMRTMTTRLSIGVLLLAVLMAAGCQGCRKRVPLTAAQNVTLSVNQALASVSVSNHAMIVDVTALNKVGLLKNDLTNSILNYNRSVAQAVIAAETVQKSTATDAVKILAVKEAFKLLKLPPDVAALIAGPQTDQAIAGVIATINSLQSIIGAIKGGN
jgi:hypothetical protein